MASITQQYVAVTGDTLTAAIWNTEFQNIINTFNGGISNSNIQVAAGIAYSKLALTGAILNADLAGSIAATKVSDTAVTLTATQTVNNKTLQNITVNGSLHPMETVTYNSSLVFDFNLVTFKPNHKYCVLGGSPIITFSNMADGQLGIIHLDQGAGGFTVTWPAVRWAGGTTPALSTGANKVDTFGFIKHGTDVFGYVIGKGI
jgi:hypothetical protein